MPQQVQSCCAACDDWGALRCNSKCVCGFSVTSATILGILVLPARWWRVRVNSMQSNCKVVFK